MDAAPVYSLLLFILSCSSKFGGALPDPMLLRKIHVKTATRAEKMAKTTGTIK
jgi:hypothetical protein